MKTAFICPTNALERFATRSDYHLVLAHKVLEDKKYADFYRHRSIAGDFIIQDCSAFELGHPIETPKLLEAADYTLAAEIVCPDVLFDGEATIASTKEFIKDFNKHYNHVIKEKRPKLMAAVQGKNLVDYLKCHNAIYNMDVDGTKIDTMGLSFLGVEKVFPDVSPTLRRLIMLDLLHFNNIPCLPMHMLGIADNPVELKLVNSMTHLRGIVRGNDSSSAYVHGSNKIGFNFQYGLAVPKIKTKVNFDEIITDNEALDTIAHNIATIKMWAKIK